MADDNKTQPGDQQEEHANPVGRPLKFKTVEELEFAIQQYFDEQDPHVVYYQAEAGRKENGETIWQQRTKYSDQKPYTMSGLARALGVNRGTILNYSKKEQFFSTIEAARQRCEEYAESQLFGPYANGAKFSLNNNYSTEDAVWADKQVLAGDKDAPLSNPMVGLTTEQLRRLAEAEVNNGALADADTREHQA